MISLTAIVAAKHFDSLPICKGEELQIRFLPCLFARSVNSTSQIQASEFEQQTPILSNEFLPTIQNLCFVIHARGEVVPHSWIHYPFERFLKVILQLMHTDRSPMHRASEMVIPQCINL